MRVVDGPPDAAGKIAAFLEERHSARVARHGELVDGPARELPTLHAAARRTSVGTALLAAVRASLAPATPPKRPPATVV